LFESDACNHVGEMQTVDENHNTLCYRCHKRLSNRELIVIAQNNVALLQDKIDGVSLT